MKKPCHHIRTEFNQKGFTVFEVVIILFIISTAIIAVMPIFEQGLTGQKQYEYSTTAINLAQDKMEQLRGMDFSELTSQAETTITGWNTYTRSVTVTTVSTGLKSVIVTVNWIGIKGQARSYSLSTLRGDY